MRLCRWLKIGSLRINVTCAQASELASAGLVEGETQLVKVETKLGKATSYVFQGPEDAACFLCAQITTGVLQGEREVGHCTPV